MDGRNKQTNDDANAEKTPETEEVLTEETPQVEIPNTLEAKVAELEAALQDEKDRALRCYAELENVRRRSSRELADERKYSGMEVIRDLLPVMDNLQRAIEAAEKQNAGDPLLAGVRMVFQQFESALDKNHCKRIEALNQPFDPNFHQAISRMPSDDHPENTILIVASEGYTLCDRVVRPSQVIVSTHS